ncbi:Transposon TX1 uncharacterized 149 kDa protein [Frankliniella fusca]|uniref:Transposon TX1 uncharacterized 149 kDa protein n=1 Tax=Frankliniella fusca TaxID=407009 RepID=A0AAE1H3V8_9NEOP|nr:Transposon TX1 uncharacterized 149 kDa protein [Frankliniella fusca]
MERVDSGDESFLLLRTPDTVYPLCTAAALALNPDDPTAAVHRGRDLHRTLLNWGPRPGPSRRSADEDLAQGLADLFLRPIELWSLDPPEKRVLCPTGLAPDPRIAPVALLRRGPRLDPVVERGPRRHVVPPSPPSSSSASGSQGTARSSVSRGVTPLPTPRSLPEGVPVALTPPPPRPRRSPTPPPRPLPRRPVLVTATWNVRGAAARDAPDVIDRELYSRGVHVAALQETRVGARALLTQHYRWVLEGSKPRGGRGVALLIRRDLPDFRLRAYTVVHRDVLTAEVLLGGLLFTVVAAHLPSAGAPSQRTALAALSAAAAAARPSHWLLLLGDFNAHLGLDGRTGDQDDVVGPALLHQDTNPAGAGLRALAERFRLRVLTTSARSRGCRVTWVAGGANARDDAPRSQVDHILSDYPNVHRVCGEFALEMHSDHKLITATLHLPAPEAYPFQPVWDRVRQRPRGPRPAPPVRPHQPRLGADWVLTRLNDEEELQLQYRTSLDEALERAAQAAAPAPLSWGRLRDALVTAANATIRVPPSPLTPRTALALDLRDRAQHAARMAPADPQARNDLREANAALAAQKRTHERDREARFFAQVDGVHPQQRLRTAYRYIRQARRRSQAAAAPGVTIREWEAEAQRLAVGVHPPLLPEEPHPGALAPSAEQLAAYARRMARNTAPGPDGIPAELFVHASGAFYVILQKVVAEAWDSGRFPEAWLTSLQHPIPKVRRPTSVDEFRPISLCNVIYKLVAAHLHHLLVDLLPPLPFYQAGFQPGRSTSDHIFVVRRVLDEYWRAGRTVHLLALDIKAAFPFVDKTQVVEALVEAGAPPLLTNRVISLALTDRTYIRWMGQATSTVTRGRGVRMGCPVSPWLFTLVLHRAVARAVQHLPRFDLAAARQEVVPAVCAYADDLLVVAADYMDVAAFLDAFVDRVREIGLVLNYRKCEYLVRSPGAPDPEPFPRPARVGQHQVQQVDRLVYLGVVITNQLSRQPGVHHRVRRMQLSATAILPTFRLHPLPGDVLDRMYNTILLPSIQYDQAVGSTTRRSRATLRREAAVTLAALHATARHPGNPRPLPPPSRAASVNRAIRAARVQFAGHIHRRPPGHPLRTALHLDLGRKKVGRPCYTFRDTLRQDLARLPPPPEGWEALWNSKQATTAYLRQVRDEGSSSEEEAPRSRGRSSPAGGTP